MLQRHCVYLMVILFLSLPHTPLLAQDPAPPVKEEQQDQIQPQAPEPGKTPPPEEPAQIVRPSETASTPSTGRKIITNFWHDQKAMWTSPFHINKGDAKWWALFAGSTAALIPMDKRLSNGLPNTVTQIRFSKDVSRVGASYTLLPIAGALYFYGRTKDDAKAREVGVLGAEALLDSAIMVQLLKLAAGRERPELQGGSGRFFQGEDGFPSGHAIETWAFASLISHEYAPSKIVPIITYGLASAVSVSRFTARKHYASDIVAGGAMGWFIGKYVFEHHLDPNIHKRYERRAFDRFVPEIHPTFEPGSRSYGVFLAWKT